MTVQAARTSGITVILPFAVPAGIILISLILASGSHLREHPDLATGIIYDLCILSPLTYFLLIRKKNIPKITVVPFFVLGLVLATLLIPLKQNFHLEIIKTFLLPAVELLVITMVIIKARKAVKVFGALSRQNRDMYVVLKEASLQVTGIPRVAKIIATEMGMFYYALFAWKNKKPKPHEFTCYEENGIEAVLGVFIFLIAIETVALHFLLIRWNVILAWILFGLSLYTVIQIFGHLSALKRRYTSISENELFLKYGLFGDLRIPLDKIEKVETTSAEMDPKLGKVQYLALAKELEGYNVVIHLREELSIESVYGISRPCTIVACFIDNKVAFVDRLNNLLSQAK